MRDVLNLSPDLWSPEARAFIPWPPHAVREKASENIRLAFNGRQWAHRVAKDGRWSFGFRLDLAGEVRSVFQYAPGIVKLGNYERPASFDEVMAFFDRQVSVARQALAEAA